MEAGAEPRPRGASAYLNPRYWCVFMRLTSSSTNHSLLFPLSIRLDFTHVSFLFLIIIIVLISNNFIIQNFFFPLN